MNRVVAVTATLATAALAGTMMVAAAHASTPAHAATTALAKAATAEPAKLPSFAATTIGSELDDGTYTTVVHCQGVDSPPPITLAKPGTPLTVNGVGPSAAILKMFQKPSPYKTIYTCTVIVREKVPAKPRKVTAVKSVPAHKPGCEIAPRGRAGCTKLVTLNTGFGGLAPQVKDHHPAG